MQWIIIIGDEKLTLDVIENIHFPDEHKKIRLSEKRLVVEYAEDHMFFDDENELINDYSEEELKLLPFESPSFVLLTYTSVNVLKKIMTQTNFSKDLYVDDDYGNIVCIEEYIQLLNTV